MSESTKAGSLTSDHIGKTIEVTWKQGQITSTIRDVLESFYNRGASVTLFFRGTKWRPTSLIGTSQDDGLSIPAESTVAVVGGN